MVSYSLWVSLSAMVNVRAFVMYWGGGLVCMGCGDVGVGGASGWVWVGEVWQIEFLTNVM